MDISVSRLNKRMALELPPEFPLGLVFVVGEVKKLSNGQGNANSVEFYLSESGHQLNCRLSERAAGEVHLNNGDLIRAGGHLAFEPARAGYYLLARDVEILSEYRLRRSALQRIDTGELEQLPTPNLAPAEIPPWVEQLAPPEIQAEFEERRSSAIGFEAAAGDVWKHFAGTNASMELPAEEPAPSDLNADLIDFLSEAMDGQEEVELTPELLTGFEASKELASPSDQDLEVLKEFEAALMLTILKEDSLPAPVAEIGSTHLDKIKKVPADDLGNDHQPRLQTIKEPEEPAADIKLRSIDGLEDDQVTTSIRKANKINSSQPPNPAKRKPGRPDPIDPHPAPIKPAYRPRPVATNQGYIPWYVVGLILLLTVLFLAVFVVVALTSNVLPLPITW